MTVALPAFLHTLVLLLVLLALGAAPLSRYPAIHPGLLSLSIPVTSEEKLEKGKFLVAAHQLSDSNFSQTVIYLVAHSQRGAMGVVVNRPTEVQLARALPHLEDQPHAADLIYAGGPVGQARMLLLIRSATFPLEAVLPITAEVSVTSNPDNLAMLAAAATAQFYVYAGYAGWSPGQLDYEVARGDWRVMPGDPITLFDTDLQNIWPTLMNKSDGSNAEWVTADRSAERTVRRKHNGNTGMDYTFISLH